ncbi:hypothetical protein I3760_01G179500 [Carya illinoinensis]|nr:hypothetical protein I3760_01G179500 [Carya illinoinensis]
MGLQDLHLKLKAFRLKRFLIGDGGSTKGEPQTTRKPSWMIPVSHGYYVVEDQSYRTGSEESESDSVVVQREQIEELELWFFGVFDAQVGDGVTKYMQSHLFNRNLKGSQIRRKSKETMRKALLSARAKVRERQKEEETLRVGSVSMLVTNAEKLVTAYMGDYRAVVCRDGVAHQINSTAHRSSKRHWPRRLISVRIFGYSLGKSAGSKQTKGSELVVGSERIDSSTEFVVLASTGIWEVMKNQEAVNLIRHLEDPQEAAECLAKEALTRMSKSNVSCLIIRFD